MRVGVVRLNGEGLAIARDSLVKIFLAPERNAKIVVRFGVIGLEGEGLAIARHGLVELPQFLEHIAQIVMHLGVGGSDSECLTIARGGLVEIPQRLEHIAKDDMRLDEIWLDGDGLGDEFDGNVISSQLMGNDTKQMQGDRLFGVGLQYLLIDTLGLGQATRGVVPLSEV